MLCELKVGSSCNIVSETVVVIIIALFLLVFPQTRLLAILLAILYIAWARSKVRNAIRHKLSYLTTTTYLDDFLKHSLCCLSCLSICQEAREAKAYGLRKLGHLGELYNTNTTNIL